MQLSTSPTRKSFKVMAVLGSLGGVSIAAATLLAGVTPAQAANFASQPDTQIAVFMVPLTLLVLILLFEVARFAWRGALPAAAPARTPKRTDWAQKRKTS